MTVSPRLLCASALALSILSTPALADSIYTKPLVEFAGNVSAGGVDRAVTASRVSTSVSNAAAAEVVSAPITRP